MGKGRRKRKPNKGFRRTQKEWEESIAGHIGKVTDQTTWPGVFDFALNLGLAYVGQDVFGFPFGMLVGPIALKLACTPSAGIVGASQLAGLTMLGAMGLAFSGKHPAAQQAEETYPEIDYGTMDCTAPIFNHRQKMWICPEGYEFHQDQFGNVMCCKMKI